MLKSTFLISTLRLCNKRWGNGLGYCFRYPLHVLFRWGPRWPEFTVTHARSVKEQILLIYNSDFVAKPQVCFSILSDINRGRDSWQGERFTILRAFIDQSNHSTKREKSMSSDDLTCHKPACCLRPPRRWLSTVCRGRQLPPYCYYTVPQICPGIFEESEFRQPGLEGERVRKSPAPRSISCSHRCSFFLTSKSALRIVPPIGSLLLSDKMQNHICTLLFGSCTSGGSPLVVAGHQCLYWIDLLTSRSRQS